MNRSKSIQAIAAAVALIIAAVFGVSFWNSSRTAESDNGACAQVGDGNVCNSNNVAPDQAPSVEAIAGDVPRTLAIRLNHWQRNSIVRITLTDPTGTNIVLPESYETRSVDANGYSESERGHYFWEDAPGDKEGTYVLTVDGKDTSGASASAQTTFSVPLAE